MSIIEKISWERYALDLNTGTDAEYINRAVELTATECVKVCNDVKTNFEITPRLKSVVSQVSDMCVSEISKKFLK
jgi:hypothetical protein